MNVLTIKWVSRYPSSYVNKLYKAARRFGLEGARFTCYTDVTDGLAHGIERLPLPAIDLPEKYRWTFWRKLSLFDPALGLEALVCISTSMWWSREICGRCWPIGRVGQDSSKAGWGPRRQGGLNSTESIRP